MDVRLIAIDIDGTLLGSRGRIPDDNLAAIDEYQQQSERKRYLDAQNDDLVEALETLENVIRKIDKETRNRFKETFDQINAGLQALFPKVFGGGHAYLELTGEDLLGGARQRLGIRRGHLVAQQTVFVRQTERVEKGAHHRPLMTEVVGHQQARGHGVGHLRGGEQRRETAVEGAEGGPGRLGRADAAARNGGGRGGRWHGRVGCGGRAPRIEEVEVGPLDDVVVGVRGTRSGSEADERLLLTDDRRDVERVAEQRVHRPHAGEVGAVGGGGRELAQEHLRRLVQHALLHLPRQGVALLDDRVRVAQPLLQASAGVVVGL